MCYFVDRDNVVQSRIDRVIKDLPDFCNRFLIYCNLKLTKLTACSYLYAIRQFFCFHGRQKGIAITEFTLNDLDKITTADIENWLAIYMGRIGMNAIVYKYSVIKTFLGYYYTRREINRNVAEQIIMPRLTEKPIIRLRPEEVSKFLASVKPTERYYLRDFTILVFFLSTGVRVSELIGLDIKHIDIDNASFVVTRKGGKVETQYMTEDLQIQLMIYMESIDTTNGDAPLFSSRDNPRISDNAIRLLVKKYITLADIQRKISPHKLRSTFGTNLYRKTRDIFAVAQCLGHSSVNTTRKYYAAMDEDVKREAIKGFSIV